MQLTSIIQKAALALPVAAAAGCETGDPFGLLEVTDHAALRQAGTPDASKLRMYPQDVIISP